MLERLDYLLLCNSAIPALLLVLDMHPEPKNIFTYISIFKHSQHPHNTEVSDVISVIMVRKPESNCKDLWSLVKVI